MAARSAALHFITSLPFLTVPISDLSCYLLCKIYLYLNCHLLCADIHQRPLLSFVICKFSIKDLVHFRLVNHWGEAKLCLLQVSLEASDLSGDFD